MEKVYIVTQAYVAVLDNGRHVSNPLNPMVSIIDVCSSAAKARKEARQFADLVVQRSYGAAKEHAESTEDEIRIDHEDEPIYVVIRVTEHDVK